MIAAALTLLLWTLSPPTALAQTPCTYIQDAMDRGICESNWIDSGGNPCLHVRDREDQGICESRYTDSLYGAYQREGSSSLVPTTSPVPRTSSQPAPVRNNPSSDSPARSVRDFAMLGGALALLGLWIWMDSTGGATKSAPSNPERRSRQLPADEQSDGTYSTAPPPSHTPSSAAVRLTRWEEARVEPKGEPVLRTTPTAEQDHSPRDAPEEESGDNDGVETIYAGLHTIRSEIAREPWTIAAYVCIEHGSITAESWLTARDFTVHDLEYYKHQSDELTALFAAAIASLLLPIEFTKQIDTDITNGIGFRLGNYQVQTDDLERFIYCELNLLSVSQIVDYVATGLMDQDIDQSLSTVPWSNIDDDYDFGELGWQTRSPRDGGSATATMLSEQADNAWKRILALDLVRDEELETELDEANQALEVLRANIVSTCTMWELDDAQTVNLTKLLAADSAGNLESAIDAFGHLTARHMWLQDGPAGRSSIPRAVLLVALAAEYRRVATFPTAHEDAAAPWHSMEPDVVNLRDAAQAMAEVAVLVREPRMPGYVRAAEAMLRHDADGLIQSLAHHFQEEEAARFVRPWDDICFYLMEVDAFAAGMTTPGSESQLATPSGPHNERF